MAPIASTISLSHINGISDATRARELYKYYQPTAGEVGESLHSIPDKPANANSPKAIPNVCSNVTSSKVSSPDTALTAFAQLVAWRLGVQRAMISVIDLRTQYFIAESTKTLDLFDNTIHSPGDDLWMGCGSVAKDGRLCEKTISLDPTAPGQYPTFVVPDLSKDGRFDTLPFVKGAPFLKFYAGTPLITKRGIAIGSLFVVDDRSRAGLTEAETHFLGTMATTIMRHLEMNREVEERRRGMKMSRGLASFVEGRSKLSEDDMDLESLEGETEGEVVAGQFQPEPPTEPRHNPPSSINGDGSAEASVNDVERKAKDYSGELLQAQEAIISSSLTQGGESRSRPLSFALSGSSTPLSNSVRPSGPARKETDPADSEASAMKTLFSRAANLIREAFEVDGGAVFYDAQKGFSSEYYHGSDRRPSTETSPGEFQIPRQENPFTETDHQDFAQLNQETADGPSPPYGKAPSRKSIESNKLVEVLGFSTANASSIHGDALPGSEVFNVIDERSLHALVRRYPRGRLWTFDEDGTISSSDEDIPETEKVKERPRKRNREAGEAMYLLNHFPRCRQLIFVPLWDSKLSRWLAGAFAWSNETTRVLTKQIELSFMTAFGQSVMAECSRIDTEIADQKKGDFIGSVSHELRSPLHGILASAEFLSEEITEGFAKSLVETIDSCGRTLLDTINHILDFSKINHFEKNWRRSRRHSNRPLPSPRVSSTSALAAKSSGLPMINLCAEVDISVICEEVVEGVFAGHVFQNLTASNFDHIVSDPRAKSVIPAHDGAGDPAEPRVAVILDMDYDHYLFTTQPGAFKRVVMNLLGNSLKYTSNGYVRIKLEILPMENLQPTGETISIKRSCIVLTVTDSGRGISSEFLRSKLFTPFAQENSLSSGTGLGLSIVRSITTLLEGEIQINSRVGQGTEVRITLPLLREMPKGGDSSSISGSGSGSAGTARSTNSPVRDVDASISLLRSQVVGKNVFLYGFDIAVDDPVTAQTAQYFKASIIKFLGQWYGLNLVAEMTSADIIIANETEMSTASVLARPKSGRRTGRLVIVLRSHTRSGRGKPPATPEGSNIALVAKPIGPLKLARVILQSLNVHNSLTPVLTPGGSTKTPDTNDLTRIFEDLSSHGGGVLDNSRMAAGNDNSRMAIESPISTGCCEKAQEFPFPALEEIRPAMPSSKSMPGDKEGLRETSLATISNVRRTSVILSSMEKTASEHPDPPATRNRAHARLTTSNKATPHVRSMSSSKILPDSTDGVSSPRLLLVDDNRINLSLLRTFMRKRAYTCIDEAENGLEAVNRVKEREEGYDIIFMDISMPVLDGFGATRQIREIERSRREKAGGILNPALVIALTGLASSRDQSEAFISGVDLFLTKPVSFKEVGKMLDNWVSNHDCEKDLDVDGTDERAT